MEVEELALETAKALGVRDILPEVYADLLKPAASELGTRLLGIAKATRILTAPVDASVWGFEIVKEQLLTRAAIKLARRGVDEPVEPPMAIAGQIAAQAILVRDEPTLLEMYAALLASAMDPDAMTAHPAFVSVIQQLSPDEARFVQYAATNDVHISYQEDPRVPEDERGPDLQAQFVNLCDLAGVTLVACAPTYLDNLVRLRILDHSTDYEPYYDTGGDGNAMTWSSPVDNVLHEWVEVTSFGETFMSACVESDAFQPGDAAEAASPPR